MKKTICFEVVISGMPITLFQCGKDKFTVQYWKQIKTNLTYARAASELGANIMHALACEGKLDNREKDES